MPRLTQSFSFSLTHAAAAALEHDAVDSKNPIGEHIGGIVIEYLVANNLLSSTEAEDLRLLRSLREDAIEKMDEIVRNKGFDADITLQTFVACAEDDEWLKRYEKYIGGNPYKPGNPKKANANQTIGSRIKFVLGADDVTDENGKPMRGIAKSQIIQTYQLLKLS